MKSPHISSHTNTLPQRERLKNKRLINRLFSQANTIDEWPVRTVWAISSFSPATVPVKVAFGVPRKNFPKAVSRNRIKRLLRECYRTEKHALANAAISHGVQLTMMFLFTGKKEEDYATLHPKIILTLNRLIQAIEMGK